MLAGQLLALLQVLGVKEREREREERMNYASWGLNCLIWDAHPIVGPDEIHLRMCLITKEGVHANLAR